MRILDVLNLYIRWQLGSMNIPIRVDCSGEPRNTPSRDRPLKSDSNRKIILNQRKGELKFLGYIMIKVGMNKIWYSQNSEAKKDKKNA